MRYFIPLVTSSSINLETFLYKKLKRTCSATIIQLLYMERNFCIIYIFTSRYFLGYFYVGLC